jgi:FkbM family methyltransferase
MLTKGDLKILLRSRSWDFMKDCKKPESGRSQGVYQWNGKPIYYRPGTSDCRIISEILFTPRCEYHVPRALKPKIIVDLGANIGIASIYFARQFPESEIFAFEPEEENFLLLEKNIQSYENVRAFPVGLGNKDEVKEVYFSDNSNNYGGFSFFPAGSNTSMKKKVQVKRASDYFREIGISRVDLMKIDTEGSEFEIITDLEPNRLKEIEWIVGELHGIRDFEMLAYLDPWFDISVKRSFKKRLFMFQAWNRNSKLRV